MTRIGVIGYGGIARDLLAALRQPIASGQVDLAGVLARPERMALARERLGAVPVVASLAALLEKRPNIVIEVAGHEAVAEHGEAVLSSGTDFLVISTGVLARAELLDRLTAAATRHAARLLLPSGAIGGIDAIAAMRLAGLSAVSYRAVKPPDAWRGSPAERLTDLDRLVARTVLYDGNAREAALRFPQNANVVALVALTGLGFEATRVELVADPNACDNRHEIEAEGATGRIAIALQGKPSAANPRTSALTAFSIARAVLNEAAAIVI
jgi:aspartate dehydrogenase